MKQYLLLVFILNTTANIYAQNRQVVDSLLNHLEKEISSPKKFKIFIALGGEFVFTNADSALLFNNEALKIAQKIKIDTLLAPAYYAIASIEASRNNYESALLHGDSAFKYFERSGNKYALAMVRNVQGGVYMASGRNELASRMFFDAVEYTKMDTGSNRILYTYHNMVILFNNMNKHDKALEYAVKQYDWAKRLQIADEIAYACSNIVDTYMELKDSAKATNYIKEFVTASNKTQDPYLQVIAKNQMGILKYLEKDYPLALNYFKQSLQLNNNLIDQQLGCITLLNLGKVYQKMKRYDKADSCFFSAIKITHELNIKEERKSAYELLIENAEAENNFEKAFNYSRYLSNIKDSLLNKKSETALIDAESKYKLNEKQKELELLNTEKELEAANVAKQRTHKWIIIFSSIGAFIIIALLFNRYQLNKKIEQHDLLLNERLRISRELHDDLGGGLSTIRLMTEMIKNPQFGLNGKYLDNISAKSKELMQNMNEIVWYLNNTNDDLAGVIAYIRHYASRFLEDANIKLNFSEPNMLPNITIDGETRRNIFLLFKEALHNIVKHAEATIVYISIKTDDTLIINIADNGCGINLNEKKMGNGLKNMKDRMKNLKGDFQIIDQNGTSILFSIPI